MFAMHHCNLNTDSLSKFMLYVCVCISFYEPMHLHTWSSMEVGVCAEAYQGGEPLRHINSAFMTFEVLDSDRKPKTLPRIRPEPVVSSTAWNPTIYSIRFSHKKSTFSAPKFSAKISALGFLVFYRMEKDVIKKLSPERRFALIGWYLSLNHHFVLSVACWYIRGLTCLLQIVCILCQCKSLSISKKYAVFSLSWTNSMSST